MLTYMVTSIGLFEDVVFAPERSYERYHTDSIIYKHIALFSEPIPLGQGRRDGIGMHFFLLKYRISNGGKTEKAARYFVCHAAGRDFVLFPGGACL